jgi:G6PDH family F420-dependent oxidoreductase
MTEIGYFLSSEEHGPRELVRQAQLASNAGIGGVMISDHFHPWLDEQGESPFVWAVIGAIAATTPLAVTTAVTCPTMRLHPAIVAQAAATASLLLEGRFELGVGTGENLNEHIFGDRWPTADERLEMLEEAVEVMRALWSGGVVTRRGRHYRVEDARLHSLPSEPPAVLVSGFGEHSTDLAASIGDGYINTKPDKELVDRYRRGGGVGLASATLKVCWGADREAAVALAHRLWRSSGVPGELSQDLRTTAHFRQAAQLVTLESTGESTPCGPDPAPMVAAVQGYIDAGFDRIYLNQIGPDQEGFFRFFRQELAPALAELGAAPDADASGQLLGTSSSAG